MDGLLIRIFKCISCSTRGNFQLKRHLENITDCLNFYKQRFNVNRWEEIRQKIQTLTKMSIPSRNAYRRRIANAEYEERRRQAKTVLDSINQFRKDTALANYRYWYAIKIHSPYNILVFA